MQPETKKLFLQNYNNEGDCKGLLNYVKTFEKEFKKTGSIKKISYLPWAVVERIFRLQDGKIEVVAWNMEIPFTSKRRQVNDEGEVVEVDETQTALLMHLKGTWQGEELDEFYPIFDNQTAKVIALPDAQDLNTARQRGGVRLIARLSGIGLSIFEQQDSLDEVEEEVEIKTVAKTRPAPKPAPKKIIAEEKISKPEKNSQGGDAEAVDTKKSAPVAPSPAVVNDDEAFLEMMAGKQVEVDKPTPVSAPKKTTKVEEFSSDSEEFVELALELRQFFTTHKDDILNYVREKGKTRVSELLYSDLKALVDNLKK